MPSTITTEWYNMNGRRATVRVSIEDEDGDRIERARAAADGFLNSRDGLWVRVDEEPLIMGLFLGTAYHFGARRPDGIGMMRQAIDG